MKMREGRTLSHEETRSRSLWLEKRRFEMPSDGGSDSSRPSAGGARTDAMLLRLVGWLVRVEREGWFELKNVLFGLI